MSHKTFRVLSFLLFTIPQGIVHALSDPWKPVGCFTDISISRTLQAASTASDSMTNELCIAACGDSYVFAGVEFGRECFCDSTIQLPAVPVNASECNMPCVGNLSETCGGPSRIQIFTNGKASPRFPPTAVATDDGGFRSEWTFQGCFVDQTSSRLLPQPVNVPRGVDIGNCLEACFEANFSMFGVEDGRECWCDGQIDALGLVPNGTRVPDTDCRGVCVAFHDEYCGNANRIAVYSMTEHAVPPPEKPRNCSVGLGNITLTAKANDGEMFPLKIVTVEMVPSISWGVLSACPACCSEYEFFGLADLIFSPPVLTPDPKHLMFSIDPVVGESPSFMSSPLIKVFPEGDGSYCLDNSGLLLFHNESAGFHLCRNNSVLADERLDVVFQPIAGHPNYVLENCTEIVIGLRSV